MPLQALKPRNGMRRGYAPRTHSAIPYPAPVQGVNFVNPLTAMVPESGILLSNLISRRYGTEFRAGWRSWSSLIPGEVRTIMPFNAPRGLSGPTGSKLFAACSNGIIYDITLSTNESTIPPVAVAVPGQLEPGEFSWCNYQTVAGHFLCIVSAGGGYWTYDGTAWVNRTASISGAGSSFAINFDFIFPWKNRLWFVVDQTSKCFYLGIDNITGASFLFDFGPLFLHGGDTKALASWTLEDSGSGIDDKLVIVSAEGDLLIYQGIDPGDPTDFQVAGRWFIGRPPNGRRFLDRYGGDLAMITQYGMIYLSKVLRIEGSIDSPVESNSYNINPVLGEFVRTTIDKQYWEIRYLAGLQMMMLNAPDNDEVKDRQFVYDVNNGGWSYFDGIPMLTCESFNGGFYFGTKDGKIGRAFEKNITSDGQSTAGVPGNDITVECQTAFVNGGDPIRWKRMLQALLTFQGPFAPDIVAQINVDWNFGSTPGSPTFLASTLDKWDVGLWDKAVWSGGPANTYRAWIGATGLGYYASLRFKGKGAPGTFFLNWMLVCEGGGIM